MPTRTDGQGGRERKTGERAQGASGETSTGTSAPEEPIIAFTSPSTSPRSAEPALQEPPTLRAGQAFASLEDANAFLQDQLVHGQIPRAPVLTTPLDQAQQRIYDAVDAEGARKLELAREALTISPDCADAYTLLAEDAAEGGDLEEARRLYEDGVHAGERALGVERFSREVGHFWDALETRPYMRARAGLAMTLWDLGERYEAVEHARALIQLNPNDNQGIRHLLQNWLLVVDDDESVERLLAQDPDEWSAQRAYTLTLLAFRAHGRGREATKAVGAAVAVNPHVPRYLLEITPLPATLPDYYTVGDKSEAMHYAALAAEAWRSTAESLDWLAEVWRRPAQPRKTRVAKTKKKPKTAPAHGEEAPSARG
jgi:tetratricopeptide (TPR) repeat protein